MNPASGPVPTRTLAFLAAASFASAASLRACDPILPEIAASFLTTPGNAASVITFFGVAYGIAQFIYGFVGERFGKLETIAFATILSAATAALCAIAGTLGLLVVARLAAGVTAAAIIPLAMAWIGDVIPYEQRQSVLARFLSGQISGITLGQVFSGVITQHFGWRFVFVMLAALFLIAGIAVAYELRSRGRQRTVSSETPGWALHRAGPMFRQPWVAVVLITAFFEGMFFFGAFTFVGSYLWARFGLGFDLIGLIVAGFGIGGLIYSASAAQLVHRLGETGLVAWGGVMVAISFVAITAAPTPIAVAPATILAGFSYYMIHNTLQTNATQMAPGVRGLAVGTFASCLFLGQSVGVALAAPVFDYTGGAPIFLTAGCLLIVLGFVFRLCLLRRP